MNHNACNEFNRAQLLRNAAATAGNGLPAVESGMPVPAGTGLTRRKFMLRSGAFMLTVYGAMHLNAAGIGEAIAEAAAGPPNPVLVSVFLDGGADSLSILAPVEDPIYRKLRPRLALPADSGSVFSDDNRLRWNPAADSLRVLHEVGYQYMIMPDHVPTMVGEAPVHVGFAFCFGYIRALMQVVERA